MLSTSCLWKLSYLLIGCYSTGSSIDRARSHVGFRSCLQQRRLEEYILIFRRHRSANPSSDLSEYEVKERITFILSSICAVAVDVQVIRCSRCCLNEVGTVITATWRELPGRPYSGLSTEEWQCVLLSEIPSASTSRKEPQVAPLPVTVHSRLTTVRRECAMRKH